MGSFADFAKTVHFAGGIIPEAEKSEDEEDYESGDDDDESDDEASNP